MRSHWFQHGMKYFCVFSVTSQESLFRGVRCGRVIEPSGAGDEEDPDGDRDDPDCRRENRFPISESL
jgi:hypothetical protein